MYPRIQREVRGLPGQRPLGHLSPFSAPVVPSASQLCVCGSYRSYLPASTVSLSQFPVLCSLLLVPQAGIAAGTPELWPMGRAQGPVYPEPRAGGGGCAAAASAAGATGQTTADPALAPAGGEKWGSGRDGRVWWWLSEAESLMIQSWASWSGVRPRVSVSRGSRTCAKGRAEPEAGRLEGKAVCFGSRRRHRNRSACSSRATQPARHTCAGAPGR